MTAIEQKKKIIAFTGRIACGKGVAGDVLVKKYDAQALDYSGSLHEALNIMGIPETRDTIQKLSSYLRPRFGQDIFQRSVVKKISLVPSNLISLIGVRRPTDFNTLKEQFNFTLIYIDSDFEQRYQRYISRNKGEGDQSSTRDQFQIKDNEEPELLIESLRAAADYVVENNGTREEFEDSLGKVFEKILQ